ncbi:nucleolar protein 56-like isoform X2 [Bolinopsis microptera]|uniref:nucleolar protein 56-like isoform X2 n=1 Tax=Bolinopsis microptera TaxID=2820187 RepID=UPI00307A43AF
MSAYILYEHAAGYALFKNIAMEDIGSQLDQVQAAVLDLAKFGKVVKLESFLPFKSGANALENINSISEGVVHDDLKNFLETMLPKKAGKLGVTDSRIAGSITEDLDIECDFGGVTAEIMRGIRFHFAKFVEGLSAKNCEKAQLGLGHSYSRCKVKFNVHRVDNMIIQSIALLDQIDKDINTFSMRLREWYSYHYPELIKIVPDNVMYAKVVSLIKSRKELSEESVVKLEDIIMDSAKARAVVESAKISMGMDISPIDLINIQSFTTRIIALNEYRSKLSTYLGEKMNQCAPNLTALIGNQVGARLIAHAGSLTNLAKYPASTVQILGAEKALFRALKTRGNTPKYGLLFHSSYIGRAKAKNKGRISRYLANKCSIASRIDCFSENVSNNVFGVKLQEQVEERLKFYETGDLPRKNLDVMEEAMTEAMQVLETTPTESEKKRKIEEVSAETTEETPMESEEPSKKKKKRKSKAAAEPALVVEAAPVVEAAEPVVEAAEEPAKKKKKRKSAAVAVAEVPAPVAEVPAPVAEVPAPEPVSAKKKKKKKSIAPAEVDEPVVAEPVVEEAPKTPATEKKKKKKAATPAPEPVAAVTPATEKRKKRKKSVA